MNRTTTNEPTSGSTRLLEAIRSSGRISAFVRTKIDRVDVAPDGASATVTTKGPSHAAHAVFTLFTFGLWLPGWALLAMTQHQKMYLVTLDSDGQAVWKRVDA